MFSKNLKSMKNFFYGKDNDKDEVRAPERAGFNLERFKYAKDFRSDEIVVFRSVEKKIQLFFDCHFEDDADINHSSEADRVFILGIIRNLTERLDMTTVYYNEVCIAVFFAFYSLVLLEIYGDYKTSLERFCSFIRLQQDSIRKIQELYYGIAWGDDPELREVRRLMLFPAGNLSLKTLCVFNP